MCNVIWRGQTRVGIKQELIELAAQTGCKELAIGVESASNDVRNLIEKRATFDEIRKFINWSHDGDIKIKMCLILGLPGEPKDIVSQTLKFIDDLEPDFVALSGFCPVPGSDIYNRSKYFGIKNINTDWSKHFHLVFRYSNEEHFGLPFEYEKHTRWGQAFTRRDIIANIKQVQTILRDRGMTY